MAPWTIMSVEFSRPEPWNGPFPSPGDLPKPGIEPRSPALQVDSLPAEPQGNPKNTGVGSLSLIQGIFPAQESSRGPLRCRQILYQLNHQGSISKRRIIMHILLTVSGMLWGSPQPFTYFFILESLFRLSKHSC